MFILFVLWFKDVQTLEAKHEINMQNCKEENVVETECAK